MKVLTVVSHPRKDSLTFKVADRFVQGLVDAGHDYEILDLHRIGFDPILKGVDEPDLTVAEQSFSPEVEMEIRRMKEHDALAFIFPLWWWNLPAMLKGYIDRVWNNGFAYGSNHLHHQHILWLGLAGVSKEQLKKRNYDEMITHLLNVGIADYCGVSNSKVEFLDETLSSNSGHFVMLLDQAYHFGLNYGKD
ncbi:Glutathione-regulated potassium-efflux system ancillary protein KefF [Paenibacillus polymyxa E681]|uniref:NAD(P)H oxidoreductase n=1 Tax=Paenibacillus polymyxa TaxID=1406 RepID=UPI0001E319F2|nr:NAD(P)H oxidoreductase [Paenibacillus polymyxa]ADM70081.1 NAD(P)H dehydrogenase (quinone) [Paenibacillus polymyxa E681]QNV57108.1 Glutathione-regulated potassium-efflux system ancillary protein KefF [Paenibacillus polymyxa E681]QNV61945.1 Glutathione-regulated potassium-efflux system ancillary protein KefF [Paenibacillus polymyxa E681]